ncbi:cartilage matrix protein-like, partial [Mizuhopecten yessoensis]|uniref:cartilage matrix protein-like n=1 Tax=Mizuhopecten yessoensis TaxID=6573 RepID=UPI000B45BF96
IVFLIDTSGSIANSDVLQAIDFICNVTKWLTIGPDDILVSVVTFDSTYDEKIKLKDYNSRAELLRNLKRLVYSKPDGGTQTDAALEFVRLNSFLPKNGGRLDANKTVVLLTDGQSSFPNKTLTQAELLKSVPNTEIFTIGIGSAVSGSNGEIRGISSDPDSYYVQHVDAFIYLCNVVPALVPKLDPLSKATAILNCPTPTTTTRSPSSGHLGWRSSTATPASQYQQIRTTRATPHHTEGEDIVFLIDTSGSIANSDVLQAVDFIYNVTKWLTIGPDDILVSVVTFDSTYDEKIKLKDYNSRAELLRNLKRLVYSKPDGGTQTDAALEFVRLNSFLSKNGGRLDANKTVVLLTDVSPEHRNIYHWNRQRSVRE